jgi:hypothetical protein
MHNGSSHFTSLPKSLDRQSSTVFVREDIQHLRWYGFFGLILLLRNGKSWRRRLATCDNSVLAPLQYDYPTRCSAKSENNRSRVIVAKET